MNAEEKLKLIQEYIRMQNRDKVLWKVNNAKCTYHESALQGALRHLHMLIESDSESGIKEVLEHYKVCLKEFYQ